MDYDDDVLVCQSCGTVLEDVSFQDNDFTSAPRNIEYYVKTKETRIGKVGIVCMITSNRLVLMLFYSIPGRKNMSTK